MATEIVRCQNRTHGPDQGCIGDGLAVWFTYQGMVLCRSCMARVLNVRRKRKEV